MSIVNSAAMNIGGACIFLNECFLWIYAQEWDWDLSNFRATFWQLVRWPLSQVLYLTMRSYKDHEFSKGYLLSHSSRAFPFASSCSFIEYVSIFLMAVSTENIKAFRSFLTYYWPFFNFVFLQRSWAVIASRKFPNSCANSKTYMLSIYMLTYTLCTANCQALVMHQI